jgi:hypothetical protein
MKKKQTAKPKYIGTHQRLSFLTLALAGLALGLICMLAPFRPNHHYGNKENVSQLRQLVLLAAEGLIVPAPVDAKTGDVYFPQAKLYLAGAQAFPQLTYSYDTADKTLRVSTKQIFTANASKLYAARNSDELFSQIPHLQACSRGVLLRSTPTSDVSLKLIGNKTLNSGQSLYVYNENQCSELDNIARQLLTVKSY